MNTMLKQAVSSGTGKSAFIGRGEGGKTGTSNLGVDLWFIGFLPQVKLDNTSTQSTLLTGIWLGNDDNSPTHSSSGQAALLWNKYMKEVIGNS
jgi:penicillin-binding protein 1A